MTNLYLIMFAACMDAMIPNPQVLQLLPEHHQKYIIEGSAAACREELKSERFMACIEQNKVCE
jgi:hypothetical protein